MSMLSLTVEKGHICIETQYWKRVDSSIYCTAHSIQYDFLFPKALRIKYLLSYVFTTIHAPYSIFVSCTHFESQSIVALLLCVNLSLDKREMTYWNK